MARGVACVQWVLVVSNLIEKRIRPYAKDISREAVLDDDGA